MLPKFLLCTLCLVHSAFSRALPPTEQVPIVHAPQQDYAKPEHMGVMIAFKRSGEDHEAMLQFALRRPIRGSLLHREHGQDTHKAVRSMKIAAVLDVETAARGSVEELERVRCRIEPQFSAEEHRAASSAGVELNVWPDFGVEDGIIILDRSDSRWFLAVTATDATPGNAKPPVSLSDVVVSLIHVGHLVLAAAVSSSASPCPSSLAYTIISSRLRALSPKVDGPQLAPLACPHTKGSHDGRARRLEGPPEEVRGDGMGVQRGDDKVDEMHALRACWAQVQPTWSDC
ncbi:hypothetical protein OPT61_g9834 [Boeremia exigua]|uniref:Uncharacterized protein n=1 Tax=Boeremia exigua TaxID=749465 RepID=A0ACC2HSD9_9PLEO|nr:hypothetical protein OPT61_g9834 [Boeremia exigua]